MIVVFLNKLLKHLLIGILCAIIAFLILGIPTALIPTGFYKRMTPPTIIDYSVLSIASLLIGANVSIYFYKKFGQKNELTTVGSGFLGFFAISCPICISFLVAIFGSAFMLTYYDPIRPLLGAISIAILSATLFYNLKNLNCKNCNSKH